MDKPRISIITPTTGNFRLNNLIESLELQTVPWVHILLWDDKREGEFLFPDAKTLNVKFPSDLNQTTKIGVRYNIEISGGFVQGVAAGSSLRAIGLMAVNTEYVTFADTDVWYEKNHLESLLKVVGGKTWGYCKRKVWDNEDNYLGVDEFESVGDSPNRKVPYEMVDNNSMIFHRRLGTSGAVLYRETQQYNDDRIFYAFLKKHGGEPGKTNEATVNQICPAKLEQMFRTYCKKD